MQTMIKRSTNGFNITNFIFSLNALQNGQQFQIRYFWGKFFQKVGQFSFDSGRKKWHMNNPLYNVTKWIKKQAFIEKIEKSISHEQNGITEKIV